jgi:hypothetical protein
MTEDWAAVAKAINRRMITLDLSRRPGFLVMSDFPQGKH